MSHGRDATEDGVPLPLIRPAVERRRAVRERRQAVADEPSNWGPQQEDRISIRCLGCGTESPSMAYPDPPHPLCPSCVREPRFVRYLRFIVDRFSGKPRTP